MSLSLFPFPRPKKMPNEIELVLKSLDDLAPYAKNSKEHPPEQVEEIARSMQEFGWTNPILIDEHGGVIAGHGRILAARWLLQKGVRKLANVPDVSKAPCVVLPHLTPAQRRAYVIADNKLAQNAPWNLNNLKAELFDLKGIGFDLSLTGFSAFELEKIEEGPDSIDDVDSQLPGAAALKPVMFFDSDIPYGFPPLRADLLSDIPPNIKTFAGREVTPDDGESWYLYMWRSDSLRGLPRDRHVIGFYVDDYRFDALYLETAKYVGKMLNMGTRIAIAPNYSMYTGYPKAVHVWAVYRSRYVARYMQEAGIAIIPDINWAKADSYEYAWLGIPANAPALSVQLQNVNNEEDYRDTVTGLREALDRLQPKRLLAYGSNPGKRILDAVKPKCEVTFVLNRVNVKAGHIRTGQSERVMA